MRIPKCDCGRHLELYLVKRTSSRKRVMIHCPSCRAGCVPFVIFDCPTDADNNRIFKAYQEHKSRFTIFQLCNGSRDFKLEDVEEVK